MNTVAIGDSNLKIADGNYSAKYPRSEEFISEGIPFIRGNNFENKSISDKNMYFISPEKHSELKKGHVKPKDVLITTRGNIGKVALVPERHDDSNINSQLVLLRCNEGWHPEYLLHTFNSKFVTRQIPALITGSALKQLSVKNLKKLKIPLPPLDQQKKIAAILDAADAYRQKTKALIEKYDELAQSLFLDMFGDPVRNPKGWEEIKLGNICGVGSSKRVFVDELVEDGIPFYRGTEVGKLGEGKSIIPKLFITKEHYERLKEHRGIPKKGDLLMPSICPDGRIWVVDDDKEFYFKDGRVLWVEVDSRKINSIYLRYYMKGSFFANYNNIASGTTFAELKIVALKKMNIFYPDIALQNQFADSVKAIEVQKTQAQASLAQAEDLFNSLLQRAFKGDLV